MSYPVEGLTDAVENCLHFIAFIYSLKECISGYVLVG